MNDAQRAIVAHGEGPLLVIAGPGSGKTFSLVLRALNLLLLGKAGPAELIVCTFTEKAAYEHRHRTPLGNGYETLDDLTQLLFIFDHFDEMLDPETEPPHLGRWQTKWGTIEGLRDYLNKITEELVDPDRLLAAPDPFLQRLGRVYLAYRASLFQ